MRISQCKLGLLLFMTSPIVSNLLTSKSMMSTSLLPLPRDFLKSIHPLLFPLTPYPSINLVLILSSILLNEEQRQISNQDHAGLIAMVACAKLHKPGGSNF